jgi:2-polyprenyl-3-methyl-5-hydroxy-6-metoxy-1,4-benzoquinol methylase
MALVRGLRALGREAWLFLAGANANSLVETMGFDKTWIVAEDGLHDKGFGCIVLDRFQTSAEELARWSNLAPVIGIDEGGPSRDCFDFLIDILPNCSRTAPNIADPSLLPLPVKKEPPLARPETAPLKVLISFGQEDAAGLGNAVAQAFAAKKPSIVDITFIRGMRENPLFSQSLVPSSQSPVPSPQSPIPSPQSPIPSPRSPVPSPRSPVPNLSEHLGEYDLVITHYGLTSFEALYAGVPVLLVSPGGYHERLARKAGFVSMGVGKGKAKKIPRLLFRNGGINGTFLGKLKSRCAALAVKHSLDHQPRQSLAELVNSFSPDASRNCPVCGSALKAPALARFPERTYRRCKHCGVISMSRLTPPPIEYGREYFFEQYQKQYGKTYIEDFPNLTAMAHRRLAVIMNNGVSVSEKPLLLDIGCAYGPFLAAAREAGFSPHGIDPAEDAVRYVTQTLGIPAVQGFFPLMGNGEWGVGNGECDVVTLWYVIEHFQNCVPALAEIHKLLKPGGVLAFSTPSFSGISGRSSIRRFLERSPQDHWTVWSPSACKRAMKAAGFTVKKIIVSGHHPERFPLLGKCAHDNKSPLYALLMVASTMFGLGDTFEVTSCKNG